MKSVKNLVYAVLLASVLGINANAEGGDQGTPGVFASPSPTPHVMATTDDHGTATLYSDSSAGTTQTSDYLFYEALAALLSVY